LKINFP